MVVIEGKSSLLQNGDRPNWARYIELECAEVEQWLVRQICSQTATRTASIAAFINHVLHIRCPAPSSKTRSREKGGDGCAAPVDLCHVLISWYSS